MTSFVARIKTSTCLFGAVKSFFQNKTISGKTNLPNVSKHKNAISFSAATNKRKQKRTKEGKKRRQLRRVTMRSVEL